MKDPSDKLEIALSFANTDVEVSSELTKLIRLPPPEQTFQHIAFRPPYAAIAVGAMTRLDQLLHRPDLTEQLPCVSITLGEQTFGPSSQIAYKTLLISLAYYSIYCLERLDEQDGERLTDALGLAMRPSMFEIKNGEGSSRMFAQAVRHAITVCAGAYWLRSFSKASRGFTVIQHHFLKPIARSVAVLLSISGILDPVLNWGTEILSRSAGKILFECTETMDENILDYMQVEGHANTMRLVRLAEKDPQLQESLGARLYTEFEKQLAWLFQSLGYFVSHARPGKRRVDLVIAAPSPCPYTFLVEAKSCQSVYSLRTADERALREYIATYQQSTHTLPRLRFVIIVSSRPSKTLENKLVKLSSSEGIPVRFVAARELAYLRNHLRGAIHPKLLLDSVTSADPILGEAWAQDIINRTASHDQMFDMAVKNIFSEGQSTILPWHSSAKEMTVK